MKTFGASAPLKELQRKFGFEPEKRHRSCAGDVAMRPIDREDRAAALADDPPVAPPCVMVIFGAAGDLTKRLVVPALYDLVRAQRLPPQFQLVGLDLAAKTAEEWSARPDAR